MSKGEKKYLLSILIFLWRGNSIQKSWNLPSRRLNFSLTRLLITIRVKSISRFIYTTSIGLKKLSAHKLIKLYKYNFTSNILMQGNFLDLCRILVKHFFFFLNIWNTFAVLRKLYLNINFFFNSNIYSEYFQKVFHPSLAQTLRLYVIHYANQPEDRNSTAVLFPTTRSPPREVRSFAKSFLIP